MIDTAGHPTGADPVQDHLTFCVGTDSYGLAIGQVREIRSWVTPTPLPQAPAHVRGVINLRGTVLPILDLALRLGLPAQQPDPRAVIIVAEAGERLIGLLVSAVSDILPVPARALMAPPGVTDGAGSGCISALIQHGDVMVRVIDLGRVGGAAKGPGGPGL